ncbi:MAG: hypothetical protein IPP14_04580 [Planctomycetes bacterium]|nr:hypothetical protein [Planctomycetota bacterium]
MPVVHQNSSQGPHFRTGDFNPADFVVGLGALVNVVAFVAGIFISGTVFNAFLGPAALAVVGVAAYTALEKAGKFKSAGHRLLQASLFIGLWGFTLVAAHWVPYLWVAGASVGLFAASLVSGVFAVLSKLWKFLAALFAICAISAVVVLPQPSGTEDPDDETNKWRVEVTVIDADGQPVQNATVRVAVVMAWDAQAALKLKDSTPTGADGSIADLTFTEDPKLKAVIVEAEKAQGPANAAYPLVREVGLNMTRGGKVSIKVQLHENAHPDKAFVLVDAKVKPHESWYYLKFQLWDGPPEGAFWGHEGNPRLLQQTSWPDMPEHSLVVGRDLAGKDLYLRHSYESGPETETATTHLVPIAPGGRTRVALNIPGHKNSD